MRSLTEKNKSISNMQGVTRGGDSAKSKNDRFEFQLKILCVGEGGAFRGQWAVQALSS